MSTPTDNRLPSAANRGSSSSVARCAHPQSGPAGRRPTILKNTCMFVTSFRTGVQWLVTACGCRGQWSGL